MTTCRICGDPVVTIAVGAWIEPGEYDLQDLWVLHAVERKPGVTWVQTSYDHDAEIGEV